MLYALCDVTDASVLEKNLTLKMAAARIEGYANRHSIVVVGYNDCGHYQHQLNHLFYPTNNHKIKGEMLDRLKKELIKLPRKTGHAVR